MAEQPQRVFELGLAMAGAISAGAYTAGVLDFLMQALDEWEKARSSALPNHRVAIKAIAGASAGAMTGALSAVALAGGLRPQRLAAPAAGQQQLKCVLSSLYDTWVTKPRMVASDGGMDLLSREDLRPGEAPASLLNARLLDEVKRSALAVPTRGERLPYIAEALHVYVTVANLRGIPYSVPFAGGGYGMQSHGDRMHYIVKGLGTWPGTSPWAESDSGIEIDVDGLFGSTGPSQDWLDYGEAALASGAFPIGLAPRQLKIATADYAGRLWPIDDPDLVHVKPDFPAGTAERPDFPFLNVDGGLINNEPFEYARFALMRKPPSSNERSGDKVDRAVIMVDPFPEPPAFLPEGRPARSLLGIAGALLPTMKTHARFKPTELVRALTESIYSRFLIAPRRTVGEQVQPYAIACGLLGGFGGFFDEQFRAHDFQLGRRNCQRFLANSFVLPGENPIVQGWSEEARNDPRFQKVERNATYYRIIPLLGSAADSVELPAWPRMRQADFERLQSRIAERLDGLASALLATLSSRRWKQWAARLAFRLSRSTILRQARHTILADLVRRDQIEGWDLAADAAVGACDPEQFRKVLAELASPSHDYRTEAGLARATGLERSAVGSILSLARSASGRPYAVWQAEWTAAAGTPLYTLESRRPPAWRLLPIVRQSLDWISAPAID